MRVLASSDIHGDKELVKELAERADKAKADAVVLCGDLTEFERDLEGLIGPFKAKNKRVLLVPGNHESLGTVEKLAEMYKPDVEVLHGRSFESGDVGFFGAGTTNPFRANPSKALQHSFEEIKNKDKKVMVVHFPPYGTELDSLMGRHVGSPSVRKAIEEFKPDLCLCGHIHENFGKVDKVGDTKVVNAGRKGKIIDL